MCPHCGPAGQMEQVEFSADYEIFYCLVCQNRYIAYALGHGEFTEPVPVPPPAPDTKLDN